MNAGVIYIMNLTDEEEKLINNYIFLPLVRRIFERDRKLIESGHFKLKAAYFDLIDRVTLNITDDLRKTKKAMFDQKMKIYKMDERHFKIVCRGYHHEMGFHSSIMREKVEMLMKKYLC
jgi:hypothetical protein